MHNVSSLYVHFPFCKHLCNYCDFYKKKRSPDLIQNELKSFEQLLEDSIIKLLNLSQELKTQINPLTTLYIGGGTPSLWGPQGVESLLKRLNKYSIYLSEEIEFTLEVNPGSFNFVDFSHYRELGVNRISLGAQSLNPYYLKILDRVHSVDQTFELMQFLNKNEVNYSVDFMLGLPNSIGSTREFGSVQNNRDIIAELKGALKFKPSHFSIYILTVNNLYPHYLKLPNDEFIEREYLDVSEFLRKENFLHYEVSNFSKRGFESKHNLRYWQNDSVLALGPSATGFFNLGDRGIRYKWIPNKSEYGLEEISEKSFLLEKLYLGLRTKKGINPKAFFKQKEDLDFFEQEVVSWERQGLLGRSTDGIYLRPAGFLMQDSLMEKLLGGIKSI